MQCGPTLYKHFHTSSHQADVKVNRYKCDVCGSTFPQTGNLYRHKIKIHGLKGVFTKDRTDVVVVEDNEAPDIPQTMPVDSVDVSDNHPAVNTRLNQGNSYSTTTLIISQCGTVDSQDVSENRPSAHSDLFPLEDPVQMTTPQLTQTLPSSSNSVDISDDNATIVDSDDGNITLDMPQSELPGDCRALAETIDGWDVFIN